MKEQRKIVKNELKNVKSNNKANIKSIKGEVKNIKGTKKVEVKTIKKNTKTEVKTIKKQHNFRWVHIGVYSGVAIAAFTGVGIGVGVLMGKVHESGNHTDGNYRPDTDTPTSQGWTNRWDSWQPTEADNLQRNRNESEKSLIDGKNSVAQQIANELSAPELSVNATNGYIIFPKVLSFSGSETSATFKRIVIPSALNSIYTMKYFDKYGVEFTNNTGLKIKNGDAMFAAAYNKSTGDFVQGNMYTVYGLSLPSSTYVGGGFNDYGYFSKLYNNTATMLDTWNLMATLKAGKTYKSILGYGTQAMKLDGLPGGDVRISPYNRQPNKIYSPFIDTSMAMDDYMDPYTDSRYPNVTDKAEYLAERYQHQVLAFLQGRFIDGYVVPEWGGITPLNGDAGADNAYGAPVKHSINKIREKGGDVTISFGGLTGVPIWSHTDPIVLAKQLEMLVKSFDVNLLDYDIEGGEVLDYKAMNNLALASAILQRKLATEGRTLDITLTLASEWFGLPESAVKVVDIFLENGCFVRQLNGMTMMMNSDHVIKGQFWKALDLATDYLANQIADSHKRILGVDLTPAQKYGMVGATFDISSDTWENERLTESGLRDIKAWAEKKGLGFLGYWSLNNDEDGIIHGMGPSGMDFAPGKAQETFKVLNNKKETFVEPYNRNMLASDAQVISKLRKSYIAEVDTSISNAYEPEYAGIMLQGEVIKYPHPETGLLHYWRAKWTASGTERPGKSQEGQFLDLGLVAGNTAGQFAQFNELLTVGSAIQEVSMISDIQQLLNNVSSLNSSKNISMYDGSRKYYTGDVVAHRASADAPLKIWSAKWDILANSGGAPTEIGQPYDWQWKLLGTLG